jgi:hypothetical protein
MTRSKDPRATRPLREEIEMLVAGELPPEDVERVLEVIATSPAAAAELESCMQLRALGHELKAAAPAGTGGERGQVRVRRRRRQFALISMVAGLAAAAAIAVLVLGLGPRAPAEDDLTGRLVAALAPERQLRPRLSWPTVDRHRPYDPPRAGAKRVETISFELLAELERRRDPRALVAAQLLLGNLPAATGELDRAPDGSDTWSDRAALALVEGDAERAIIASAAALRQQPDHPQAQWNRALALDALGLDRSAAAAFEQLAARGEPGWSDEARAQAAALTTARSQREAAWKHANDVGTAMVGGGPPPLDQVAAHAGLMRLYFYDAVRAAPSAARVGELRPLAAALDASAGGRVLVEYIDRIIAAPFAPRAPLAARYLAMTRETLDAEQIAALIADLRAARQPDLLLGALTWVGHGAIPTPAEAAQYAGLARETRDPWFELLAEERRGSAALASNDAAAAESILRAAGERCSDGALAYRCRRIWERLADVYRHMHRPAAATVALDRARRAAATLGAPADNVLPSYAHIATQRDDTGGARHAVVMAYLDELDRSDACDLALITRDSAVMALVNENRLGEARALMARQRPCDTQFTYHRAFVVAHLVDPADRAAVGELRARIGALRATAKPHELAMLDHIEGRLLLPGSPDEARALLRRAIAAGGSGTEQVKARSYSYSLLIQDVARSRRWTEVIQLLAEERGIASPERCVLGIAEEDAAVFAAIDAMGAASGVATPRAVGSPLGRFAVPAEIQAALRGCSAVDVLARQPYYGRADLLPREQVWRYRGGPASDPATTSPAALVVGNIDPPPSLGLPPLNRLQPVTGAVLLEGAGATPARVLEAMREVGFVELHSHGLSDGDDAALLVLAPDAQGSYALTSSQVAAVRLEGRPVVMLAACGAGASGTRFHTTWSLPDAFLQAGARAVIASSEPIADASAQRFFAGVRERIAAGAPPARALHEERLVWSDPAHRAWIDRLVVFQ